MCLVTAFFDPRTEMSPRSGPDGSTCQVSVTLTTVGPRPVRNGSVAAGPGCRRFRPSAGQQVQQLVLAIAGVRWPYTPDVLPPLYDPGSS